MHSPNTSGHIIIHNESVQVQSIL